MTINLLRFPQQQFKIQSDIVAVISLSTALLAVSFAAIFIRLSEAEIGANATVFNRFLVFALAFGMGRAIASAIGFLREDKPTEEREPLTVRQWLLLIAVGVISTTSLVLWALSLIHTSVANSVLLNNLTPLFVSIGGWLFLGHRFDRRFVMGLAIALAGAIAIGFGDLHLEGAHLLGDAYALLSAIFLGTYFLLVEQLRDRFSATTILLWRCGIGTLVLIPIVLVAEGGILFPTSLSGWLAAIGLGLICEGMGQRLLADSLDKLSSSFVCLFLLLEPIVSAILAWIIFAESLSLSNWLAFAVVLIGIYLAKSSKTSTKTALESA